MAHVEAVTAGAAAAYLSRFRMVDPCGRDTVADVVRGRACYRLHAPGGTAVYALRVSGGRLWVSAAAGRAGQTLCPALAAQLEQHAREAGVSRIAFQTARRGLVRRAQREGFTVAGIAGNGFIMEKTVK